MELLQWEQNEKGNWKATTPSETTIVVFKRRDRWSWSATRKYEDTPTYSENDWEDAESAQEDISARCATDGSKVIPDAPPDYFDYNIINKIEGI